MMMILTVLGYLILLLLAWVGIHVWMLCEGLSDPVKGGFPARARYGVRFCTKLQEGCGSILPTTLRERLGGEMEPHPSFVVRARSGGCSKEYPLG